MPVLSQIAFSVADLDLTIGFYRDVFGLEPAGGTRIFRGPIASSIQGLPDAASECSWLIDGQGFFQLEFFKFERPTARPKPAGWRPCDIGYNRIGIEVRDFRQILWRLEARGVSPLAEPRKVGGAERACVIDPDGVLVEIIELKDLMTASRVAGVALSVPDLLLSRRFFVEILGATESTGKAPGREALWGLGKTQREVLLFDTGGRWIEISQYKKPTPKPRPTDYRISDLGLSHIALGFRDGREFKATYERARSAGYRGNSRPMNLGVARCVYLNDDQGFTVELLSCARWADGIVGFKPPPTAVGLINGLLGAAATAAYSRRGRN